MINLISEILKKELNVPFGFCSILDIERPRSSRINREGLNGAIMFIFPYNVKKQAPLNISRYAAVPDYHDIIIPRLKKVALILSEEFPENTFKAFADYSPILEVKAAALAGLGVIGENGLLITEKYGSFVFIGSILTDINFSNSSEIKHCISCGKCKAACPVNLNKEACISAVTQKRGDLTKEEISNINKVCSVFGCDICQYVCPYNNEILLTEDSDFILGYRSEYKLNEDSANRAYNWRGEEIIKRNFKYLNKNI